MNQLFVKRTVKIVTILCLIASLGSQSDAANIRVTESKRVDSGTWVSPSSQRQLKGVFSLAANEKFVAIRVVWQWENDRSQKWEQSIDYTPSTPGLWAANSDWYNGWNQRKSIYGYKVYLVYRNALGQTVAVNPAGQTLVMAR